MSKQESKILRAIDVLGEITTLAVDSVVYLRDLPWNIRSVMRHTSDTAVGSLFVVALTCLFMGMVMALQTGVQLAFYGTQDIIGAIVGVSLAKELGPVMTSLLVAGRVGSAMAAEIGAMRIYEEVDALKTLNINPVRYLAMPRLVATTISVPALTTIGVALGIIGGAIVSAANPQINVSPQIYFENLAVALVPIEIIKGLVKATFFGAAIAIIGCYVGFNAKGGAAGIGQATTRSVVSSFVTIMAMDYVLTRIMM